MKTSKYLALGLSVLLALSLVSCGGQQAQEPQEPKQEVQQTEPVTTEPTAEPEQLSSKERAELSGDELISYFQRVYDIVSEFHTATTEDGLIQEELEFLADLVESDGEKLPSDYEAQYRAWRPAGSLPADIQSNQDQQNQQTQGQQSQGQQTQQGQTGQTNPSKPSDQQQSQGQQQGQTQTQQPSQSTGGYDPYDGFGSYEAYIDYICQVFPDLSREEVTQMFPDPATGEAGPSTDIDIANGRLSGN